MTRALRLLSVLILGLLASACGSLLPSQPAPTPTLFRPANLLTPRALPATQTPEPALTAPEVAPTTPPRRVVTATGNTPISTPRPIASATPSPVPTVRGTPVAASEPLLGFLVDDRLNSPIIGESFAYRIYLPPDYLRAPQRRYPVLYMLHGNGGNYTEWSDSYLPEQADRLISDAEIPPMIIVMPDDAEATYWANWSEDGPRWADYVAEDVVSTIDQRYRTVPTRAARGVGGLSMGGLGALNLAFHHPDIFGVVGGHSPSVRLEPDPALWFLTGQAFWENNPVWLAHHQAGLDSLKIWLDAGTEDVWLPNIEAVHDALIEEGLHPNWHVFPGPHEAEYWIEHVPDYLRFYGTALRT